MPYPVSAARGKVLGSAVSDATAPTCVITCTQTSPTTAGTLNFTITFSEPVTGFEVGDFAITNGTKGALGGSGAVYTCDVTPTTAGTPVTANVSAGVCVDLAGNANLAAAQLSIDYYSAIYYVRKDGNDTTGNGSTGTPWLTISKAMTTAGAGHLVRVGDGTYAESTGGAGYWRINKNLANWLTIEPENGALGVVRVTATTSTIDMYFTPGDTSAYLRFRYLTIGNAASATTVVRQQGTVTNIQYANCTFDMNNNAAYGFYGMGGVTFTNCTWLNAKVGAYGCRLGENTFASNMTFTGCTIVGGSDNSGRGISIATTTASDAFNFVNCTVTGGQAFNANGSTITITGGTYNGVGAVNCVLCGVDASSGGNTTTATITNCTIDHDHTKIGHALIFGHGCLNCHVDGVTIPDAYDYAIVVKENTGTEIENCTVTGGTSSALLYKAAVSANAHHNTFNGTGGFGTFQLRNGDTGVKCQNWRFENNIVNVSGASKALNIGNSTHDAGGGICDFNTYENNSGLGVVRNDSAVANLTELQAAWADYDVTTNDANSTVV